MTANRRLDTQILRVTSVGQTYTVGEITRRLDKEHHQVTGAMRRLSTCGYFAVIEIDSSKVRGYVRTEVMSE